MVTPLPRQIPFKAFFAVWIGWILQRERSVSGMGGQTVAYEVNHCAYLV